MLSFTIVYGFIQIGILVSCISHFNKNKNWHIHTNTAASILTIIGVFGTFLGIFGGLMDFGIEDIEASIPGLLEGLKQAFLTSLAGIGSAILLKTGAFIAQMKTGPDPNEETLNKFVDQLTIKLKNVQTSGELGIREQLVTLNSRLNRDKKLFSISGM